MVLLAAVCMFSAIPYVPVTASERTVSIESEDKEIQEQAEAEETGNSTDESGQIKESETDGSKQTEEQEKESTGTEESENLDEKDQTGEAESGKEENPQDLNEEESETG